MTNHINIKKLTPEKHLNQYNELLRYAFQVTQKQLLDYGWEDDDIRQSKLPVLEKARVRGCFCRDKLASQFAVYPMKMNIFNQICKIGFITSVATYPEYTGMGLMSKLMRKSLEEMRELGENLAILYPFSIPLYRHRGGVPRSSPKPSGFGRRRKTSLCAGFSVPFSPGFHNLLRNREGRTIRDEARVSHRGSICSGTFANH